MNLKVPFLIFGTCIYIKPTKTQWVGMPCTADGHCENMEGTGLTCKDHANGKEGKCAKKADECFPGISEVLTEGNEKRKMEQIQIGEIILTLQGGKLVPTTVVGFLEKYSNKRANEYLNLTLESGNSLRISGLHLVFVAEMDNNFKSVMAKDIKRGNMLMVQDGQVTTTSRVLKIKKEVLLGVYAPLTSAGTMIVDNVWVSCYADVVTPHWLVHFVMAPVRWWPETLLDDKNSQDREGIKPIAIFLRSLGRMIGTVSSKIVLYW